MMPTSMDKCLSSKKLAWLRRVLQLGGQGQCAPVESNSQLVKWGEKRENSKENRN